MSIASKLAILEQCKTAIKNAITAKGGTVTATSGFSTFASEITDIPTGGDIGALIDRSITELTIPNGVTTIGRNVFYGCTRLVTVTMPDSILTIDTTAFYNANILENLRLSKALTEIGTSSFQLCSSIENITIPNTLITLNSGAFRQCTSLNNVVIPPSITRIPQTTFDGCASLTTIILPKQTDITTLNSINAFDGTPFATGGTGGTVYAPSNLISTYQSATNWSSLNCTFKPLTETTLTGDGTTTQFTVTDKPISLFYVIVNNVTAYPTEDYTYTYSNGKLTFTTAPANGATIKVYYDNVTVEIGDMPSETIEE